MTDLHQRLLAAIDAEEATAKAANTYTPDEWRRLSSYAPSEAVHDQLIAQNPATTLGRLAEDRDVLARHHSDSDLESQRKFWECVACSVEIECNSDRCGTHYQTVLWPCPEILSVARRHGIDP